MKKIAIVGDSIVDEYFETSADKISPEFPVPILQLENSFPQISLPGGAANVCYQFLNFDKHVSYFGFVDLESLGVFDDYFNTENCVLLNNFHKVPRKKRFYQNSFPLCRIDVEIDNYGLGSNLNYFQNKICNNLSKSIFDIVIFSDYDKGIFNEFDISNYFYCCKSSIKIVDPKKGPISKWRGCDIIKPNYKEAKDISGKSDWRKQADYFKKETGASCVLITQGGEGVVGIINNDYFEYRPDKKTQPDSVVGAGDCFVSLLAIGISDGLNTKDAAEQAFYGSSLYVKNKHNKPIHPADLVKSKIIKNPEVLCNRDFTLCFTNGCFDFGLTPAHVDLLKYAKKQKEKLVVALNSDLSVRKLKGESRPFFNFEERSKILSGIEHVDYIVELEDPTPEKLLSIIKPDLIIKGGDYKLESVVGYGLFPVKIFDFLDTYSTTEKIIRLKE